MNQPSSLQPYTITAERRFELLVSGISDYAIYMLSPEGIVISGSLLKPEIEVDSISFRQHLQEPIKLAGQGLVGERAPTTREPMRRD